MGVAVSKNRLLRSLTREHFALLAAHLERADLPVRKMLESRGRRVTDVYFLESGVASIIAAGGSQHSVEVGMTGNDGMTGIPLLMGVDRSPHEIFIQAAGSGWRIGSEAFSAVIDNAPELRVQLLRFAHVLQIQMCFTALANARYKLEERLARWLLMAHDRADGATVTLTHEFLSLMLGVRRPGITIALSDFEKRGIVATRRGEVIIKNRRLLEEQANGSYGVPEAEYERLFGASP
jgi:CRP-like cAMP-binding protein